MYGFTDVRTDGHVTITSQPKFLGLIGYHISLAMELRWRALPAGSAKKEQVSFLEALVLINDRNSAVNILNFITEKDSEFENKKDVILNMS